MAVVIPSPLCQSFEELVEYMDLADGKCKRLQIDVVDGVFASPATTLPPFKFSKDYSFAIDYHLMVKSPVEWVEVCAQSGANRLIGHIEQMASQKEFVEKVLSAGLLAGLALDLETPIEKLDVSILSQLSVVLVLCVKAGQSGQKFHDEAYEKLSILSKIKSENNLKFEIGVDGGVDGRHLARLVSLGVNEFCIGKRIFVPNFEKNMMTYQKIISQLESKTSDDPEIAFYMERPVFRHVAFFGDADVSVDSDIYKDAFEVAKIVAQGGLTIVNGGGPGVMDASTKGAEAVHGETLSVTFYPKNAPGFEGRYVGNVTDTEIKTTNYIERMFKLMEHADIFIIFKGGTGTISELGTAWVLAKLYFGYHKPFILFGDFWRPIIDAIYKNMLIDENEMSVFEIVSKREDVLPTIERLEEKLKEAFKKTREIKVDKV